MINIKKILVPVDFSDGSQLAMKYAASFALEFASQVHIIHVIEEEALHPGNLDDPLHVMKEWEQEQSKKLDEFTQNLFKDFDVVRAVRGGLVFEAILEYSKEKEIELIIMGAHGQSGYMDAWLGGTSYEVARKANCPVLTIKPSGQGFVNT